MSELYAKLLRHGELLRWLADDADQKIRGHHPHWERAAAVEKVRERADAILSWLAEYQKEAADPCPTCGVPDPAQPVTVQAPDVAEEASRG